eukprot:5647632-Prymnesium_polylepis.3
MATTAPLDLPAHLHFALFAGSDGFVLKPPEMLAARRDPSGGSFDEPASEIDPDNNYWPPAREHLICTSLDLLSLHNLPKVLTSNCSVSASAPRLIDARGETRPDLSDAHHKYCRSELSGVPRPPKATGGRAVRLSLTLHPIGGPRTLSPFVTQSVSTLCVARRAVRVLRPGCQASCCSPHDCRKLKLRFATCVFSSASPAGFSAITTTLPLHLAAQVETELVVQAANSGGFITSLGGTKAHLVSAEPLATFLRITCSDRDRQEEVAYACLVLGRLRCGYRAIQLKSPLGTRIELAFIFVRISVGDAVTNHWATQRQLRWNATMLKERHEAQSRRIEELRVSLEEHISERESNRASASERGSSCTDAFALKRGSSRAEAMSPRSRLRLKLDRESESSQNDSALERLSESLGRAAHM